MNPWKQLWMVLAVCAAGQGAAQAAGLPGKVASAKPGMVKFALKGGVMLPREGRVDDGVVVGVEAALKLPALGRIALQGDVAAGDIDISPTRNKSADQRYLHLDYILTPRLNSPIGKFYFGAGLSQGWTDAPAGGSAKATGANVLVGYEFPNHWLVEGRHVFMNDDKTVDMGGTTLMGGYRF